MEGTLTGKVALVTGGGGGLGRAVCEALGSCGATVIPTDVRWEAAETVANAVRSAGGTAMPFRMDVADAAEVEAVIHRAMDAYGRLDILVNNAGVDVTISAEALSVADWDRILATNLRGPFLTSRCAFPIMQHQKGGYIVNVVSTAALRAWANAAAYHASKWGLLGLSRALHVEGRPHNIKVSAIIAGGMRTPFLLDRFPDIDVSTLQEPRNVADAIRFVLSQPEGTVIPELMVLPLNETSWP